jgi:Flp pilus assembly protein TadD
VHLALGHLLARMGMLQRAEAAFFRATSLVGEPAEAYSELARIKCREGQIEEAAMHVKNLLFYRPNDMAALQDLGRLLLVRGSVNEGDLTTVGLTALLFNQGPPFPPPMFFTL